MSEFLVKSDFLVKTDFLGIISSLLTLKEMVLENIHDIDHREFLIRIRKNHAISEALFTNEDQEAIIEFNKNPWFLHHNYVKENNISGGIYNGIFGPLTNDDTDTKRVFEQSKREKGSYNVTINKNQKNDFKNQFKEDIQQKLKTSNTNNQNFLNVCYNHSSLSSVLLRRNMELTNKLCQIMIEDENYDDVINQNSTNFVSKIRSLIPYVGIVRSDFFKDNHIMDKNTFNVPFIIFLVGHFKIPNNISLSDTYFELHNIINEIIIKNEKLLRTFKNCSKLENNSGLCHVGNFAFREKNSNDDVGTVSIITFQKNILEKISWRAINDEFYNYQKDKKQRTWETEYPINELFSQLIL